MQEFECSLSVDGVRSVEMFYHSAIAQAHFDVMSSSLREFVVDPLIGGYAIIVPAFDHKWPRKNQPAHLSVIECIAQVEFWHVILSSVKVRIGMSS